VSEADVLDQQTLELDKRTNEDLLDSAKEFYRQGLYAKAVGWLREVVRRPDSPGEAHCLLGATLIQRHRFLEAIPHLRSATKRGFDRPEAHLWLGKAYLAQYERKSESESAGRSKQDLALDELARAITMPRTVPISDEILPDAHITAGRAEVARHNRGAALEHFELALRGAPGTTAIHETVYTELRKLLPGWADLDKVLARLHTIIHRSKQPVGYFFLALLLKELARPDAAFAEYLWYIARYAKLRNTQRSDRPSLSNLNYLEGYRWCLTGESLSDAPKSVAKRERLVRLLSYPLVEAAYGFGLIEVGAIESGVLAQMRAFKRAPTDADVQGVVADAINFLQDDWRERLLVDVGVTLDRVGDPAATGHVGVSAI
jgi:hypothetical protein